ncbi:MAG: N-acetylmuramoyl-L-alanine amidase [candidate division KSB1 bacterium]|nr:N-acetylmuramoyl-L-alanine amidase [candidate division KSB1 bacterium]
MMQRCAFQLLTVCITWIAVNISSFAQIKIEVIYPKEGSTVVAADSTFIFGNVQPSNAKITINGKAAELYPNGAFLAYVPVTVGRFNLVCRAFTATERAILIRQIYVPNYLKTSPKERLEIDTSYIFPREDWIASADDLFKIAFKGTPGCRASFSIDGLIRDVPMIELSPKKKFFWGEPMFGEGISAQMKDVQGIYTGVYVIKHWDWADGRQIRFRLMNNLGDVVEAIPNGRLFIDKTPTPIIGELMQEVIIPQANTRLGSQLCLAPRTRIVTSGRRGNYVRFYWSQDEQYWLRNENIRLLPPGAAASQGTIAGILTEELKNKARLKILMEQRLPFKVEQSLKPRSLRLTLYGIKRVLSPNTIDLNLPEIRQLRWDSVAANRQELRIILNQNQLWGYDVYYVGDTLYVDLKKPPSLPHAQDRPLQGLNICLDPGHNPDDGAVGPKGNVEKDWNYRYCYELKKALEVKGAFVMLTRGEKDGATLSARAELAKFIEADLLISMHFNALPDGVDPFDNRGVSTYYFHPHSYSLAKLIHKKMVKYTGLKNFGLFNSNLAMCRPSQMISVLLEPGFLTHPWEEILIVSEAHRERVVRAIVDAIIEFIKENG